MMISMKKSLLLISLTSALLSSCSTKFSASQRATLNTVAVDKTTAEANAYKDPNGAATGTANSVAMATGGGIIGALVGHIVEANQNRMFKDVEGKKFAKLRSISPKSVNSEVNQEITKGMKGNPFFASRLRKQSPNRLTSKVISFSLARTGNAGGVLLMSPQIVAEVKLVGADGKAIGSGWNRIIGTSTLNQPVSVYLVKPALLKRGYEEAARNLGKELSAALAKRTTN